MIVDTATFGGLLKTGFSKALPSFGSLSDSTFQYFGRVGPTSASSTPAVDQTYTVNTLWVQSDSLFSMSVIDECCPSWLPIARDRWVLKWGSTGEYLLKDLSPGGISEYVSSEKLTIVWESGDTVALKILELNLPSTPRLQAKGISGTQIDLSWEVDRTGGSDITGYKIEVSTDGMTFTDLVVDTASTATTYSHTGLSANDTVYYKVSVINAIGTSDASDVASATAEDSPPRVERAQVFTSTSIELTFDEALVLHPLPDTSAFTVKVQGNPRTPTGVTSALRTNQIYLELATGDAIRPGETVTVSYTKPSTNPLKDAAGNETLSFTDFPVDNNLPPKAPEAPGNLEGVAGNMLVSLTWETPWDNGDPITRFQIRQKADTAAFGAWGDILNSGATTTADTVTGLTNSIPYTFEVRAVNGIGFGSESNDVTVTPVEVATPTVLSVALTSSPQSAFGFYRRNEDVEATVTFDAAVDITGSPQLELDFDGTAKAATCAAATNTTTMVCSYRVGAGDSAPDGIEIEANKLTGGTITATGITTVSADLDHAAVPIDAGQKVDAIRPTLVDTGADAPTTSTDGTKVILTFSEDIRPVNRSLITIQANGVTLSTTAAVRSGNKAEITLATALTAAATNLTVSLASSAVHDIAGNSILFVAATAVTNVVPPPPPLDPLDSLKARRGDGEVRLEWVPVATDATNPVRAYQLRYVAQGGEYGQWRDIPGSAPGGPNERSHTVTGLENGTRYAFELRVRRESGFGTAAEIRQTPEAPRWSVSTNRRSVHEGEDVTLGIATRNAVGFYSAAEPLTLAVIGRIVLDSVTIIDGADPEDYEIWVDGNKVQGYMKDITFLNFDSDPDRDPFPAEHFDLEVPVGSTSLDVTVKVLVDDDEEEGQEHMSFMVFREDSLVNDTWAETGVNIESGDAGVVKQLAVADAEATEGEDPSLDFVVTLAPAADWTVEVDYATHDGTARAGADYTNTSGTLTFSPGDTAKTVSVPVIDDTVEDTPETLTLRLSNEDPEYDTTNVDWGSEEAGVLVVDSVATGTIRNTEDQAEPPLSADFPESAYTSKRHAGSDDRPQVVVAFSEAVAGFDKNTPSVSVTGASGLSVQAHAEDGLENAYVFFMTPDGDGDVTFALVADAACASGGICTAGGTELTQVPAALTIPGPSADPSSLSVADAEATEEEDGTMDFVVTLAPAASDAVTVDYATSDGTATAGEDYAATSGTLTFAAGDTTKTISVPIVDDAADDGGETFTLSLGNASGAALGDAEATGTILDDDNTAPLTASFSDMPASHAGEEFTFGLAFSEEVEVGYATLRDTAFVVTGGEVSQAQRQQQGSNQAWNITVDPDGQGAVTITLPETTDCDAVDAICTGDGRPLSHSLSSVVAGPVIIPTVSVSDASAAEGDAVAFTVALSAASSQQATVEYATSDGTAASGTDYTADSGTLTFAANETTKTVSVATTDDSVDENDETFTLTLSSATNATLGDATATGMIEDDDSPPVLSVSDASAAEGDAVEFTVSLSAASAQQVTVEHATSDGTAASGTDYTADSGTLTFAANETTKTVSVATTDDSVDESDETFTLTLSSATNATLGDATATGMIEDDDSPPVLSVSDASAAEGDAVEFTVSLSAASAQQVTVEHATSDGTAASGTDYTADSGTLTFAANETTKTVSVATTDDSVDESDETFTLTLSSATNATLGDATATGMIEDDDSPPVLSVSDASAAEGDAVEFTVSLSAASAQQVTVEHATSDGTAASGTDYTADSGTLTFAANETTKTVSVATTDDSVDESDETFTLTLSSATNATLGDATATGMIEDDDSPPVLSVSDASAAEGDAVEFTVSLSAASAQQVTVEHATSDGTAASGTDYTADSGTLTFAANETTKTVSVATTDDSVDESDETFTLTLSSATNATLGDATATGTINDDDESLPTVSVSDASADEGDAVAFTVSLSEASSQQVTVDYATSDGTATSGTDFTTESGMLTFAANETTKTVSVATTDDSVDEEDETFTLTLSSPTNATLGDATATGTINDNDVSTTPLTASFSDMPASHTGEEFTFGLTFSENVELGYATLRDTALVVTGGEVKTAQRQQQGSNRAWNITVEPDGQGAVAITLPETTDCDASGAICTHDERPLSHSLSATVAGPVMIPAVSVSDASAAEGDSVAFAVSLSSASSQQATVDYATSDGTAAAGEDYTAQSGTLTFAANETTKTVSVATTDDSADEDNETFTLTLSSPANATLGDATATGTIDDNDVSTTPLTASFSDMPASHAGEEFTFGLAFSENVELSYATLRDTALVVTGGEVKTAQRQQQGSNQAWNVTVEPASVTDTVTITLPETTDCDAADAICTHDDRPLSHSLSATVVDSASASAGDSVGGDAADDPLALLDGLTTDEAAEALFGERRLGEARLEALDRLGNRNGRYDLGDLLSWIERCRRGEARCGTDPADSSPASAAALLGAAAAGRRRVSNSKRPKRRGSGRLRRRPVRGMRRRARMAGYALAMLFAATMAWSCTGDFGGPPAAGQGPGFLTIEWTGPAEARDIGVLLELEGPGIETVRAPGLELYESRAPGRHRIIVAGSLRAGALVQFRVPDRGQPTLYRVRILQVTGEDYGLRDVGEYRAVITN